MNLPAFGRQSKNNGKERQNIGMSADALFGNRLREGTLEEFSPLLKARFPYGNYLVLTDEESAPALETVCKTLPKKLTFVLCGEEDVLPLFAAPDGITCVVGAGAAMSAARYFAAVRSLPFAGLCLSCAPRGLGGKSVRVSVNGETAAYPVPMPDLIFLRSEGQETAGNGQEERAAEKEGERACKRAPEADNLSDGREDAEAFLSACALSAVCSDACRALGLPQPSEAAEWLPLFSAAGACGGEKAPVLFRAVLTAEYCLGKGFPPGEIFAFCELAEKYAGLSRTQALRACTGALSELYALFFEKGFYRGGAVDYNARREEAAGKFPGAEVSVRAAGAEELVRRAAAFADCSGALSARIAAFRAGLPDREFVTAEQARALGGILRLLPELTGMDAITTLMRDFALL